MMRKQQAVWVILLAGLVWLAGCSREAGQVTGQDSGKVTSKGRVESVDAEQGIVTLNHEELPGLMMAMTMPFAVAGKELLKDLKEGDAVEFDVEQRAQGLTIVAFRKIHPGALNLGAAGAYEGIATVIAVNPDADAIGIMADDIPGIPGDQLMVYPVDPPSLLEGISDDDKVQIKIVDRGEDQLVVTELKKLPKQ